jgi:hypothetical protein
MTTTSTTGVTASDDLTVAVHTEINPQRPTIPANAVRTGPAISPSMIRLFARFDVRQT